MKPKILFIMHMPPPIHGAAVMGQYIHNSEIINKTFECYYINLTTAKDLDDIGKGGYRKYKDIYLKFNDIRKSLKRINPDLVYITPNSCGAAFYKDFLLVEMIKIMGYKLVAHFHNKGVATHQNKLLNNILYQFFFKDIKIILLANILYEDVKRYVKRENIYICPNGIKKNCTDIDVQSAITHYNQIPHILFLSNLLITKGIFILLDALKILHEKNIPFFCDFVGGETYDMSISDFNKEVISRGLNNHIKYHGSKYGKEKRSIISSSDIFVFPTFNETFGLVLLEAMELCKPCIGCNEGGIPDIIDNNKTGLIVPPKDSKELANAIEKLLDNTERRVSMGIAGREKFLNYFTIEKFELRLKAILEDCLKTNCTKQCKHM